jgi:hypothetical protein
MIKVSAIQCPKCKDIIYSRAVHDYHGCSCPKGKHGESTGVTIDGGFDYVHVGWANDIKTSPEVISIEVDATIQDLYNDWNNRADKFGLIKSTLGVERGAI